MMSSYLATVVYLDLVDTKIFEYLQCTLGELVRFKLVRYVDDLYILLDTEECELDLKKIYTYIRNEYSSILKEYGLALNSGKCTFKSTINLNEEVKKSLYDEIFNKEYQDIELLYEDMFVPFLEELQTELFLDNIDIEKYHSIIENNFSKKGLVLSPNEILNYYIYENSSIIKEKESISLIKQLIKGNISFMTLDPKRLTIMVMRTKNEEAIKSFLRQLFEKNRKQLWNAYDTMIVIAYLLQSGFKHIDLLKLMEERDEKLYSYYDFFCREKLMSCISTHRCNVLIDINENDKIIYQLYFLYLCEYQKGNILAAYAYFKNYFDRTTANLAFKYQRGKEKKPNYKGFYSEKVFIKFYAEISGSKEIIKKAHDIRNANPVSHASSDLITKEVSREKIENVINDLENLIKRYVMKQSYDDLL